MLPRERFAHSRVLLLALAEKRYVYGRAEEGRWLNKADKLEPQVLCAATFSRASEGGTSSSWRATIDGLFADHFSSRADLSKPTIAKDFEFRIIRRRPSREHLMGCWSKELAINNSHPSELDCPFRSGTRADTEEKSCE